MSGIQRPAALEALNTRLFRDFEQGLKYEPFGAAEELWSTFESSNEFNTYALLANHIPGMREWIGARRFHGLKERVFTIYNKTFEDSIRVPVDRLNDGQIADASSAASMLAQRAARLPEDLLIDLLENGQSRLCYDGQFLFDTDHPTDIDAVGTQRNYYASGLALDATNLNTALTAMAGFKGEDGMPLGVDPNILLVPSALYKTALDLVEARTVATGGENTYESKFNLRVVKLRRAASATRWWLIDTQSPGPKAFILQNREAPSMVAMTAPDSPAVFYNNNFEWGVKARYGMGPGLWHRVFSAAA